MTPKEKANELYNKYAMMWHASTQDVKSCALIAVGEILELKMIGNMGRDDQSNELEFWVNVRKEIKRL